MKVLIAAGEAASDPEEVPASVRQLVDTASEVLVMSPSLVGPLQWLTGDIDRARHVANERLAVVLGQLEAVGRSASGVRGDESPRAAFEDAVRQFNPDHIVIAVPPTSRSARRRHEVIDYLLDRFGLPVTVFAIGAAGRGSHE